MALNLDTTSTTLAKPFLAMLPRHKSEDHTEGHFRQILIEDLYEPLRGLFALVQKNAPNKLKKEKIMDRQLMQLPRMLKHKQPGGLEYMPSVIEEYITTQSQCQYQIHYTYEQFHFYVAVYDRTMAVPKEQELYLLIAWLLYARNLAPAQCNQRLDIYLFLTPFLKEAPLNKDVVLSPLQINTGFTQSCSRENEIVIYRQEEWFKVTIHESIHAFELDPQHNEYFETPIKNIFHVAPHINVFFSEMYTEVWARILNVVLKCMQQSPTNKDDFVLYVELCLEVERLFSVYQRDKVLAHMQLTYPDLIGDNTALAEQNFQQDTHVLSYFVLSSVCLANYSAFLVWCEEHNGAEEIVKFEHRGNEAIVKFLQQHARQVPMSIGGRRSAALAQTLRMSVFGGGVL